MAAANDENKRDRRAADLGPPTGEPDRRKRGRPSIPEEQRQRTLHVKLTAAAHDAVCRSSLRRGIAVNAILRAVIERAVLAGDL